MFNRLKGFTLVELLVVIGIIALLVGILLPTINKARESGNTIKCAANLRSIGQGLTIYVGQNRGTLPASYLYRGMVLDYASGTETPATADQGYVHWSSYLYGSRAVPPDAFRCPSLTGEGLPPTNTVPTNLDSGQVNDVPGILDDQAERCAY